MGTAWHNIVMKTMQKNEPKPQPQEKPRNELGQFTSTQPQPAQNNEK